MNMPLVSVIMPVYNTEEKYLRSAIESITQSIDNLNNTLKIIKDDLLTDEDDNEGFNT